MHHTCMLDIFLHLKVSPEECSGIIILEIKTEATFSFDSTKTSNRVCV